MADGVIHVLGVSAGLVAAGTMMWTAPLSHAPKAVVALAVYGFTLVAMLVCPALYNLTPFDNWKGVLGRFDQAAIFTKIAGTYTPFALMKLGGFWGYFLLATVWSIALCGAAFKLARGSGSEKLSLALYLGLGWVGLLFIQPLLAALSTETLVLLGLGGLFYSIGVIFHVWEDLPYQNAIWHLFVLVGTALHFAAVVVMIHGTGE